MALLHEKAWNNHYLLLSENVILCCPNGFVFKIVICYFSEGLTLFSIKHIWSILTFSWGHGYWHRISKNTHGNEYNEKNPKILWHSLSITLVC